MQAIKVDDEQLWLLIEKRMDESGITINEVAEKDLYLAQLIKRRRAGYPVTINHTQLYKCTELLGLIYHREGGEIPSRDDLIALFQYGQLPCPRQGKLWVDWGCE